MNTPCLPDLLGPAKNKPQPKSLNIKIRLSLASWNQDNFNTKYYVQITWLCYGQAVGLN